MLHFGHRLTFKSLNWSGIRACGFCVMLLLDYHPFYLSSIKSRYKVIETIKNQVIRELNEVHTGIHTHPKQKFVEVQN